MLGRKSLEGFEGMLLSMLLRSLVERFSVIEIQLCDCWYKRIVRVGAPQQRVYAQEHLRSVQSRTPLPQVSLTRSMVVNEVSKGYERSL